jgi:GTPase
MSGGAAVASDAKLPGPMTQPSEALPKAVLVAVQLPGVSDVQHEADVAELSRLVRTLGLEVVGLVTQRRFRLRAGTVLGLGKLMELAAWTGGDGNPEPNIPGRKRAEERRARQAEQEGEASEESGDFEEGEHGFDDESEPFEGEEVAESDADEDGDDDLQGAHPSSPSVHADIVVVDHELSPRMQRNLERATGAEVLDRTQVIVEIFNRHAKSREARLQVELARLAYVAPRLRETGAGGDRQRGGIGGKGAGESAVELDRRKIRDRMAELRRELAQIEKEQATRRAARRDQRRVALVGYTNAGKSSLMRALTSSGVYIADKLFATLDTTVRALKPETEPRILVSDTVGFIKKLPHELVASFRSTLDEALEASLLLYVVDASDPTFREQLAVTREVLGEIGAGDVPSRLVLNKRDRLDAAAIDALALEAPEALIVSSKDPADVARVRDAIVTFFDGELCDAELFIPYAEHGRVQWVYEVATILGERHDELGTHLAVRGPRGSLDRLRARLS